jgi:hypothetical protein
VPEVDPSGHIYFSTMPIVNKTFIIDELNSEIEVYTNDENLIVITVDGVKTELILNPADAKVFVKLILDAAELAEQEDEEETNQNQSYRNGNA